MLAQTETMNKKILSRSEIVGEHQDKLKAATLLNSLLTVFLAHGSPDFVSKMEQMIEGLVSSGHKLPGDFEAQARNLVSLASNKLSPELDPQFLAVAIQSLQG